MNTLEKTCFDCGLNELAIVEQEDKLWQAWQTAQSPLFQTVIENKPETSLRLHLLGLLTKSHIELISSFTSYVDSINAMKEAIDETVGKEHANKFKTSHVDELTLLTHAWLYVQGYLGMDFSLANDHAYETAKMISSVTQTDIQTRRSSFLESYYTGVKNQPKQPKGRLREWLERLFNPKVD
ncbi:hypothetical protein [uncultured Vibrio sp.]|uniref:hypothetical protein n=1 Tax=uncultured Vibrio sp. TaxID=114054 RepID=UPI0025F66B8D|nr:hypothetical protein [uncultured Vibrio sp.]